MKKFKIILNLIKPNEKTSPLFLLVLCFLSFQVISAQETPLPTEKPVPVRTPNPKIIITPDTKTTPKINPETPRPNPRPVQTPPKTSENKNVVINDSDTPAEKSVTTESKVKVTLCVKEGKVQINGWDRDEIRAYVEGGSQVGFKVVQKNPRTDKPVWVYVLGFDPKKNKEIKPEECLSGEEIQLDVPRNSSISLYKSESDVKIESVGKAEVELLSGDIFLNDISNGIDAKTYRGDLIVENSSGKINLENTDGNVIALGVSPSEIGDVFKARTNSGRITLQAVEHRQIETSSISGSTSFDGELLSGGQYSFSTTNGSIGLAVPQSSLCKINAWFGFGAFASEIPLQNVLKKEQSLSAQIGSTDGTCSLNLKTGSGVIKIKNAKVPSKNLDKNKDIEREKDKEKNTRSLSKKKSKSVNRNGRRTLQSKIKKPSPVLQSKNRKPR